MPGPPSIVTVTLNAAIDQTVRLRGLRLGCVNRTHELHLRAGGKGINVASMLAAAGHSLTVTGFLGRDNTDLFERAFATHHLDDRFVRIDGVTRTNVKLVDDDLHQTTDLNAPGAAPAARDLDALNEVLAQLARSHDVFVLAGSLPPGVDAAYYGELVGLLRDQRRYVVLDTSGPALAEAVRARPNLIAPNLAELAELTGRRVSTVDAAAAAARELTQQGIETTVVTMGARGALVADETRTLLAVPPAVEVVSTVGAGDAFVAGWVAALADEAPLEAGLRRASAWAVARVSCPPSRHPGASSIRRLASQIEVRLYAPQQGQAETGTASCAASSSRSS